MFDTLEEQMKIDERKATTTRERMVCWSLIALFSVILFGALLICLSIFT